MARTSQLERAGVSTRDEREYMHYIHMVIPSESSDWRPGQSIPRDVTTCIPLLYVP
jgi:hypothetical protein